MMSDGIMNSYFYKEVDNEKIFELNPKSMLLEQGPATHKHEVDEIISKIKAIERGQRPQTL